MPRAGRPVRGPDAPPTAGNPWHVKDQLKLTQYDGELDNLRPFG